jgi:hypothetical protein
VRVIYAVPSNAQDRQRDTSTQFPFSIAAANAWLQSEIGRKVVFDTSGGALDVVFAQLPRTEADYDAFYASGGGNYKRQWIEYDLVRSGAVRPGERYLVFYEGGDPRYCGYSAFPSDQYPQTAVVFLNGANGICARYPMAASAEQSPGWSDYLNFHELFHLFGAAHPPQPGSTATMEEYTFRACDLMQDPNPCGNDRRYVDRYRQYYYNPEGFPDSRANLFNSPFFTSAPRR